MGRQRVLVISEDPVGEEMGGNAIRAFELAKVLAQHAEVKLAAPSSAAAQTELPQVPLDADEPQRLVSELRDVDVVLTLPQGPGRSAQLRRSNARVVYDLYDPKPLQMFEAMAGKRPAERAYWARIALDHTLEALLAGDFLICAGDRQRDLWLGALLAAGQISPSLYETDPTLRCLLDVVPFGIPPEPPAPFAGNGPRERFAGLEQDAEIVLWNGGLWDWLDPVAAVQAVALIVERRPRVRLVFMGAAPSDPAQARAASAAHRLAAERGLLDRVVFFNDRRVPYPERSDWLLAATCAISLHTEHLETRFSFRTRLLDCFWAGLPIVCTAGDELADLVERAGLGASVPAGRPELLAERLLGVIERGRSSYEPALAEVAGRYRWTTAAAPLVAWMRAGAPPRPSAGIYARSAGGRRARAGATRLLRALMRAARRIS